MKKSVGMVVVLWFGSLWVLAGLAGAAPLFSESLLDKSTEVYSLDASTTLFIDRIDHRIQALDLSRNTIKWELDLPAIYDSRVFTNPHKIIIITSENNHPRKVVLSAEGKILSSQVFTRIVLNSQVKQVAWTFSAANHQEELAVAYSDRLFFYQAPWFKASRTVSYALKEYSRRYENVALDRVWLEFPYAVLKLRGGALVQGRDLYRVLNLSSGGSYTLSMPWNLTTSGRIEGEELVVTRSSIAGSPGGIDVNRANPVYTRYALPTGKVNIELTKTFSSIDSNWTSDYFNHRLMLMNSETGQLEEYDQQANLIGAHAFTGTPSGVRFVGYRGNQLWLLKYQPSGGAELITVNLMNSSGAPQP
ncbi:hypothetical protein F4V43_09500 [Paenibacillus spiritus]|uniref:Uncharacterized protein n=1 Tax=Paenibacillus spiritus TaxID=2496557 RepID=A0A5J5GA00_9BACL|nr:hypothetical protein [Paenibacillus spiritus]KAA9004858.1 hypothetical protein F4V43_09500 [Paenibacillus spiritus]